MRNRTHLTTLLLCIAALTAGSCNEPTEDIPSPILHSELNVVRSDGSGHQIIADGGWEAIPTDSSVIFANGDFKLFRVNYDGSNLTQLYPNIPWGDHAPSPTGDRVLMASGMFESGGYLSELYLMNPDGTNLVKLTTPKEWYTLPRISPNLEEIVFCRDGGIATTRADGTGLSFIKTKTDSTYCMYGIYVDNDNILYFEDVGSFSIMKLFNKTTRTEKFVGTKSAGTPAFTRAIVGSSLLISDFDTIKVINVNTAEVSKIGTGWGASFSSDGSKIVSFIGNTIYVMDASGQNQMPIYTEKDSEKSIDSPLFSPDNKYIVFRTSWAVYSF